MGDVTRILSQIEDGDPKAAEQLLPLVYEELRKLAAEKIAREKPGQTLQATALVHEAYVRLVDTENERQWNNRGHFLAAAAKAMRRILVDSARRKGRNKRGGQHDRVELLDGDLVATASSDEVLALDEALRELAQQSPEKAELVQLRFFAGLTLEQAAESLGISRTTACRHWSYARAWLYDRIHGAARR